MRSVKPTYGPRALRSPGRHHRGSDYRCALPRPNCQSQTAYLVADVGWDCRRYGCHGRDNHRPGGVHKELLDEQQNAYFGRAPLPLRLLHLHRSIALGGHSRVLPVAEVEMIDPWLNPWVQATPDCALLFVLAQVSGAPDPDR
jgi:hypothetical protein